MAYPRPPPYHPIPHSPQDQERKHHTWDPLHRHPHPSMASPTATLLPPPGLFDPESESSDVSDDGEGYRHRGHPVLPNTVPPPLPKHAMDSQEAIANRLRDLSYVEDLNIKKLDALKAKRARKDERIRRKREAQDFKIKAIMDARTRRDERIARRRRTEDDAFGRCDEEIEEEETNLRRRIKRLKRGLPVDEFLTHDRSLSSASMSPPAPPYIGGPPPAKRHQSGPPGQGDSPITSHPRAPSQGPVAMPPHVGTAVPQYAFLPASHPPPGPPYNQSPTYMTPPANNAGPVYQQQPPPPLPPPHTTGTPSNASPYATNGLTNSPHVSRPLVAPSANVTPSPNTAPPPRHASSTYDTRPPPPMSSGFATINQPPPPGFAAINPRNAATPPAQPPPPLRQEASTYSRAAAEYDRIHGLTRPPAESTPPGVASNSGHSVGKRTPSTTHPYQMSEAFANRHHHCERVDGLNRGIWTYFGPGGTQDNPNPPGTAIEMYLRCNHDDCRRIDWRTVHGLQCHIVKNHEQPKGTIGSLEKALDRYGVAVAQVEAYEKEHGEGTGGTMADPKNLKMRTKAKESSEKPDKKWLDGSPHSQPPIYRANVPMNMDSPGYQVTASPAGPNSNALSDAEAAGAEPSKSHGAYKQPNQPRSGFAAVNESWSGSETPKVAEQKDVEMNDAPPVVSHHGPFDGSVNVSGDEPVWQMRPPEQPASKPATSTPIPIRDGLAATTSPNQSPAAKNPATTPSRRITSTAAAAALQHLADASPMGDTEQPDKVMVKQDQDSPLQQSEKDRDTDAGKPDVKRTDEPSARAAEMQPPDAQDMSRMATADKGPEQDKEKSDGKKSNATSPENTNRRFSMAGTRRGSSRRSSLAASRAAEKEREAQRAKEREEELAAAEKEREREREKQKEQGFDETSKGGKDKADLGQNPDADDDQGDGSTITVQPDSAPPSAKKERDRGEDGTGSGRTSKRLTGGRFVGKKK